MSFTMLSIISAPGWGETPRPANYREDKVAPYQLPDPLVTSAGKKIENGLDWRAHRPELLRLFEENVYGKAPPAPPKPVYRVLETSPAEGGAVRKTVEIAVAADRDAPRWPVVFYLPPGGKPAPVFIGMHLFDTQSPKPNPGKPLDDPGVAKNSMPGDKLLSVILARGYAIATLNAKDIAPDSAQHYADGVIGWYAKGRPRAADDWGAIGAWAWALARTLEYCQTDPAIDSSRVIAIGHSRMGKTALWAAAKDERFAMAISNNSGCGGAALSKRVYGETVALINNRFPHWFCENFRKYNDRESDLPVDQHQLIALIAPRPVYVASADKDAWADPLGEFLAARAADPVYRLWGHAGLPSESPPLNVSVGDRIGYHRRVGGHALTDFDWMQYLNFTDRHWRNIGTKPATNP